MNIIIFEDGLHDNFYPLTLTRPLWDLRTGLYTFRERHELFISRSSKYGSLYRDNRIYYFTRENIVPCFRERYPAMKINDYSVFDRPGPVLFLNALAHPSFDHFALQEQSALVHDSRIIAAHIDTSSLKETGRPISEMIYTSGVETIETGEQLPAQYIWELVESNGDSIINDYQLSGLGTEKKSFPDVTIIGDSTLLHIENNVSIAPYTVIDLTGGPVVIREGTAISPFTLIEGPSVIGRENRILGAKIRKGTTLGDFCRIGGEVEQTIIQGFANKYHEGFIGHSYVGEWVNLGAMTTNSDLKNNYTKVKVYTPDSRKKTGLVKMGCFIGDHVKTSIGTLINTGTSIGTGAMLVHSGTLTPFHVPPFAWFVDSSVTRINWLDEFLSSCQESMSRRGVDFSENSRKLLTELFSLQK